MGVTIVTGQTATGKTKKAIEIALLQNAVLVNADARQVYKGLDIVTGKDLDVLRRSDLQTFGFDLVNPDKEYSSYNYVRDCTPLLQKLLHKGSDIVVVGGSYFYIAHLLYGHTISALPNPELRAELNPLPVGELQKRLGRLDESQLAAMNMSDRNNPRRLIRKIEILMDDGAQSKSYVESLSSKSEVDIMGLQHPNRESLVKAITTRVDARIEQGAIEETKQLLTKYKKTDPGLQTIGYHQLIAYLEGTLSLKDARMEWITKEVQYAKRQLTFMKRDENIHWRTISPSY